MTDTNQLPPLPTPKFTETIRGVPCITVTEHEHLIRAYALQARAQVQGEPVCGAQNAESDPQAPLSLTAAPQQATPDDMKVYASIADRYFREATQAEVADEQINAAYLAWCKTNGTPESFARAILALRPERVPMTDDERGEAYLKQSRSSEGPRSTFMRGVFAAEAHHNIKPKEQA